MSAVTIRLLPDSIHRKIRELAARDGMSINQFIASAASEKVASWLTVEYLNEIARHGTREDFERVLAAVPDAPYEFEAHAATPEKRSKRRQRRRSAT
ncbi:MAG: toxin-antitoxin system HicB family antitoxin [Casimicrobiaceae bacterium]|nr:toxin-antitoxin system HicB family antitoxin [Casimicrobiaceae bacterium]MDW8313128.1 hypothetical protein [Burkholderiales bacterium]